MNKDIPAPEYTQKSVTPKLKLRNIDRVVSNWGKTLHSPIASGRSAGSRSSGNLISPRRLIQITED